MTRTFTEKEIEELYQKAADGNLISKNALIKVLELLFPPEPDPYAELKAAKERGEVIQSRFGASAWMDMASPMWNAPPDHYRVKPAPKLVPMASEDLPPVVWVRRKGFDESYLATCFSSMGSVHYGTASYFPVDHFDEWEYSPDRKTWLPLMKEVEA